MSHVINIYDCVNNFLPSFFFYSDDELEEEEDEEMSEEEEEPEPTPRVNAKKIKGPMKGSSGNKGGQGGEGNPAECPQQ